MTGTWEDPGRVLQREDASHGRNCGIRHGTRCNARAIDHPPHNATQPWGVRATGKALCRVTNKHMSGECYVHISAFKVCFYTPASMRELQRHMWSKYPLDSENGWFKHWGRQVPDSDYLFLELFTACAGGKSWQKWGGRPLSSVPLWSRFPAIALFRACWWDWCLPSRRFAARGLLHGSLCLQQEKRAELWGQGQIWYSGNTRTCIEAGHEGGGYRDYSQLCWGNFPFETRYILSMHDLTSTLIRRGKRITDLTSWNVMMAYLQLVLKAQLLLTSQCWLTAYFPDIFLLCWNLLLHRMQCNANGHHQSVRIGMWEE